MMRIMHCTYTELDAQPADELEVFRAFLVGEESAQEAERQAQQSAVPPTVRQR